MAIVDRNGIEVRDLTWYVERLEALFRNVFGEDLDLSGETPQGQLVSILAAEMTELDEGLGAVAAGMNLNTAVGRQLIDWGSLYRAEQRLGTRSTVSVTLGGVAGTFVPEHSRAKTSLGAIFRTTIDATIGSGGTVETDMEGVEAGPLAAAADDLTVLVDIVSGWTSVNNASAASPGLLGETNAGFRNRLQSISSIDEGASAEAILARVLDVGGVVHARVYKNDTAAQVTEAGLTLPANSFMVVVRGGSDNAIAKAIRDSKTGGIPMVGADSGTSVGAIYNFQRSSAKELKITLDIVLETGFPSNGVLLIKESLVEWVDSLGLGVPLNTGRLYEALNPIPGYLVSTLTVEQNPSSPASYVDANGDEYHTLDSDDIVITVS